MKSIIHTLNLALELLGRKSSEISKPRIEKSIRQSANETAIKKESR